MALRPIEAAGWITPVEGDRMLACGPAGWVLSGEGGVVARGLAGGAEQVVDHEWLLFYVPGRAGEVEACSVVDGMRRLRVIPTFGNGFEPVFVARRERKLLCVGVERPIVGHSGRPGLESVIDVFTLPDPIEVDGHGWALGCGRERLLFPTAQAAVASLDDALLVAVPDEIIELDYGLTPRRVFQGKFVPHALSLSPGPRLHLLAEAAGRRYYWAIAPDGERLASVALPIGAGRVLAPPILAADTAVGILLSDRVLGLQGDRIAWELSVGRGLPGPPVGGTRSADGQLLLSAGGEVVAVEPSGRPRTLAAADDPLTSAPMLDGKGRLWVAARSGLLAFTTES
jgi:hypothetical protein